MPRRMTPESQVLKAVMDYLAAERIFSLRMNTGAIVSEYKGKQRFMRFGVPGQADVLAFPKGEYLHSFDPHTTSWDVFRYVSPLWLEVKAENGKQSALQKSFQAQVEAEGHRYAVVRSVQDLKQALGRQG